MAARMSKLAFEECLKTGGLRRFEAGKEKVMIELGAADKDLLSAETSYKQGNYKWAIIQGYYAIFHAARALIFTEGYRERSHKCLLVGIRALYVDEGRLGKKQIEAFEWAMGMREEADYQLSFSRGGAKTVAKMAEGFLVAVGKTLKS